MTDAEWKDLRSYLFACYPNLREWLERVCAKDSEGVADVRSTLDVWRKQIGDCTLEECKSIIEDWLHQRNNRKAPEYREYQDTALLIRSQVMFERSKLRKASDASESMDRPARRGRDKDAPSLAVALAKAMTMKASGIDEAEIEAEISKSLGPSDPLNEPRYHCHACLDSGIREVVHPDDIEAIRKGRLVAGDPLHYAATACNSCEKGERVYEAKSTPSGKKVQIARFNQIDHCLRSDDPFTFASKPRVMEWVP